MEMERRRESVGWARGWQKEGRGRRQTGARRQANGTGGRLPDGRLMEPRADFIFHGPSFLVPLAPPPPSARSGATFVLATGCRNTVRYGGSPLPPSVLYMDLHFFILAKRIRLSLDKSGKNENKRDETISCDEIIRLLYIIIEKKMLLVREKLPFRIGITFTSVFYKTMTNISHTFIDKRRFFRQIYFEFYLCFLPELFSICLFYLFICFISRGMYRF